MEETKVKEFAKNNRLTAYVRDSFHELTKVTWPTKNQAVKLTMIVLGLCLVFAVFLAGIDFIANYGYTHLVNLAK